MAMAEKRRTTSFYELCRLCLQNPGFCNVSDKVDLPHDIFLCTGVKMSTTDTLPQKICTMCYEVVIQAKNLRALAMRNDKDLKTLFDDIEDSEDILSTKKDENVISSHFFVENSSNNRVTKPDTNKTPLKKDMYTMTDLCGWPSIEKPDIKKTPRSSSIEKSTIKTEVKKEDTCLSIRKRLKFEGDDDYYSCDKCNKTFSTRKKKYLHDQIHKKKVVCPFDACQMKFTTKGDLKKHVRSHTGEKPYSCSFCKSKFTQKVSLRIHEEQVHDFV